MIGNKKGIIFPIIIHKNEPIICPLNKFEILQSIAKTTPNMVRIAQVIGMQLLLFEKTAARKQY